MFFELIFSPRGSIKGAGELIKIYEYWPSFHDDEIEELNMDSEGISITLHMNTKSSVTAEYIVIFRLDEIEQMEFKEWYSCNILYNIDFKYSKEFIKVEIYPSLRLEGSFLCKTISVEVCYSNSDSDSL